LLHATQMEDTEPATDSVAGINLENVWVEMALSFVNVENDPSLLKDFVQVVSVLRVGIPALAMALTAKILYPATALQVAALIGEENSGVFAVVAQDASQYIQNILTTSGLVFSLLVGQTYYFMVRPSH